MPTLNEQMEFYCPVVVREDGTVEHTDAGYIDELGHVWTEDGESFTEAEEAEWIEHLRRQGWEPLIGFTGQDSYSGAVLHPSEFIGGGLERYILSHPGVYVVVAVEDLTPLDSGDPTDAFGWAVLRKIEEPAPLAYAPTPEEPFRVLEPLRKSASQIEKERLFPNGIPLTGDLTPEQQAWLRRRN